MKLEIEHDNIDIKHVSNIRKIYSLSISFSSIHSLKGIEKLLNLKELRIYYCKKLKDISQIQNLKSLRQLILYSIPNLQKSFRIQKLEKLQKPSFTQVKILASVRRIEKLKHLTELALSRVKVLDEDFTPIIKSKSLKRVFWFGSPFKTPAIEKIRKNRPDLLIRGNSVLNK